MCAEKWAVRDAKHKKYAGRRDTCDNLSCLGLSHNDYEFPPLLVRRWLFDVIDHNDVNWRVC